MRTQKELQDKLNKMELRLESLYSRKEAGSIITRYEAKIEMIKWTLGLED